MKKFFLEAALIFAFLLGSSISFAVAKEATEFACTMEYAPVCATVQVQCVRAPCYPIYKTFGNACTLSQESSATFVHNGECTTNEESAPAVLSERLKTSLKRQYDTFITTISGLPTISKTTRFEVIKKKIEMRLLSYSTRTFPMTLEEEMRADRMKYALLFLQDLVNKDIAYLQDEANGMRYVSRDNPMCTNIRFYCMETETPFFNDRGCGCKK